MLIILYSQITNGHRIYILWQYQSKSCTLTPWKQISLICMKVIINTWCKIFVNKIDLAPNDAVCFQKHWNYQKKISTLTLQDVKDWLEICLNQMGVCYVIINIVITIYAAPLFLPRNNLCQILWMPLKCSLKFEPVLVFTPNLNCKH